MDAGYKRQPDARAPRYDASAAGYFIGSGVILAIIGILYVILG